MARNHLTQLRSLLFLLLVAVQPSHGDGQVDFTNHILPILQEHCIECHGPDQREGGLLLTHRREALLPNDSGRMGIVPHNPDASELLRRVQSDDPDQRMPPTGPLAPKQIDRLRSWIEAGATWPDSNQESHWAYVAPRRPSLPIVDRDTQQDRWARNAIDTFVLARLKAAALQPSPEADPAKLVRRVYLDLIGLPPPVEVVDQFVSQPSDAAYAEIVDRLLGSSAYGAKWASHWLDLSRYSDSNGYQADQLRDMWAYRDWVIDAMNRDLPFDQFSIEQLAGDLIPNADASQQIATGFHRATTCNVEAGVDPEANRTDQVIDRVNTTATVWLGTTLECAQCHNHKYDPFSQLDYYQLFAFFNNTPIEVRKAGNANGVQFDFWGPKYSLPQRPEVVSQRRQLEDQLEKCKTELRLQETQSLSDMPAWEEGLADDSTLNKRLKQALALEPSQRKKADHNALQQKFWKSHPATRDLQKKVASLEAQVESLNPKTTLVMVEMEEARSSNIFLRGQFSNPGQTVRATTPSALHAFPQDAPRNRLGLARWLVSRDNPLTARVTVNRWWQEFFGRGIVTTPEDFGTQSDPPTHPQLLDWLAYEFMNHDWSMKSVHRSIVMSSTYRQSSEIPSQLAKRDPTNELYARGARFRLRAEGIRDNALSISGLISNQVGGLPSYPPQPAGLWRQTGRNEPVFVADQDEKRFRRGVYVVWRRAAPYPSFVNFDAPDRMACVVSRSTTNTPLQALTLLNDEAYFEMAKGLAERTLREAPASLESRLIYAFRLCVSRVPSADELATLKALFDSEMQRVTADASTIDNLETHFLRTQQFTARQRTEWAAMVTVASVLLNLDETITRG